MKHIGLPVGDAYRLAAVVREIYQAAGIGRLRRAFLSWISEFTTNRKSMSVNNLRPKPALNPETSKKE
jgi:hypothetical protein